ncbi:MAG: hypothetical protein IH838_08235 [Proteobacteria bacterium]|nr:hypothetical protein [Pseudomonadota bacterium]
MKRLPPYGRDFQPVPKSGVRVAIGPGAWDFAKEHHVPILVLPVGEPASNFTWPSDGGPALVHERGEAKGDKQARKRLTALAQELLFAGASSVVAISEAYLDDDPRVFFDPEVSDVAA